MILILHHTPKQRTVYPELALLITEEAPRAYLDDHGTLKFMFFRLAQIFFIWRLSQAFHALFVRRPNIVLKSSLFTPSINFEAMLKFLLFVDSSGSLLLLKLSRSSRNRSIDSSSLCPLFSNLIIAW